MPYFVIALYGHLLHAEVLGNPVRASGPNRFQGLPYPTAIRRPAFSKAQRHHAYATPDAARQCCLLRPIEQKNHALNSKGDSSSLLTFTILLVTIARLVSGTDLNS